jgi:hypothetical protein
MKALKQLVFIAVVVGMFVFLCVSSGGGHE